MNVLFLVVFLISSAPLTAAPQPTIPQRVVSTALTADEILYALIGDTSRLVAISTLATNALHSNIHHQPQLPPTLKATSIEHIVSLRPDLIVYSVFNRPEFVNLAKQLAIDTVVLDKATRLEDILANITRLGKRIGAQTRAAQLCATLQRQLQHIAAMQPQPRPRVLNFFADNTVMGRDTLFDALITHAGGLNLAAQQKIRGFRIISTETLATLEPDFIIIPIGIYTLIQAAKLLQQAPGWKNMRAVKQQKFIPVPSRTLMATSHHAFTALAKLSSAFKQPATVQAASTKPLQKPATAVRHTTAQHRHSAR